MSKTALYRCMMIVLVLVVAPVMTASADSLDGLRASGAAGERYDGYAEALSPSAKATVDQVNAQRKKIYQQRATQQGVSADQIGRVYAEQILNKAPAGTKYLRHDGTRITK